MLLTTPIGQCKLTPPGFIRLLRSPRSAAVLLAATMAVLALSAVFPASRAFVLGPVLLGLVALLTLSTGVCAWDRSVQSWHVARGGGSAAAKHAFPLAEDATPADVLEAVSTALRSLRLRPRSTPGGLIGSRSPVSTLGSPLFHWALVALFALAAAGQATRHEGIVLLVQGRPVVDAASAYTGTRDAGPLFSEGFTGVTLELLAARRSIVVDGVDRGAAPQIAARDPRDGTSARQWVYPNGPLRFGGLMVSRVDAGPAVELRFSWSATPGADSSTTAAVTTTETVPLISSDPAAEPYATRLTLNPPGSDAELLLDLKQIDGGRIAIAPAQRRGPRIASAQPTSSALAPGESTRIGDLTLTFESQSTWSSVAVVNDWSVPWLYAAMLLVLLGAAAAVLWPYREVRATVHEETPREVRIEIRSRRIDPAFPERASDAIEAGLRGQGLLRGTA